MQFGKIFDFSKKALEQYQALYKANPGTAQGHLARVTGDNSFLDAEPSKLLSYNGFREGGQIDKDHFLCVTSTSDVGSNTSILPTREFARAFKSETPKNALVIDGKPIPRVLGKLEPFLKWLATEGYPVHRIETLDARQLAGSRR